MKNIMRHTKNAGTLSLLCLLFGLFSGVAQVMTTDRNYIHEVVPQQPVTIQNINNTGGFDDVPQERHLQSVSYFDGLGRPSQTVSVQGGGTLGVPTYAQGWAMDWTTGTSGTAFYKRNGAATENTRVYGSDAHGKSSILWRCDNDAASDADGGWNTIDIYVDKNSGYRYSVWVKRTGSHNGTTYHGTQNVAHLGGGPKSNPYFWSGDLPNLGQWYLMVGIVHPNDYTGADTGISGVYDIQGNKVADGTEYRWQTDAVKAHFRSYLYYCTDTATKQYFHRPVLERLDGSELPLAQLIAGPQIPDVISFMEYDGYGRQAKEHLSYPIMEQSGRYYEGDNGAMANAHYMANYPGDFTGLEQPEEANPYSETLFEPSPLNRVLKQAAPGGAWKMGNGHEIEFAYQANANGEVRRFDASTTLSGSTYVPSIQDLGHYAAATLQKTVTYDENHGIMEPASSKLHTTEEFKDQQGRVVLKRTYALVNGTETAHDTYYVYDDYGNLTYVLPPKMEAATASLASLKALMEDLGYQYRYDHRNRLVEKHLPGKEGWEYIVYNTLDWPVMTQDPNLAAKNQWLFTKYDAFGRVAYTGKVSIAPGTTKTNVQGNVDSGTILWEDPALTFTNGNLSIGYSNQVYPMDNIEVLTVNYYDDYSFNTANEPTPPTSILGQQVDTKTKGLSTGTKTKVLDGTNSMANGYWITTVNRYDAKGRPIYTYSENEYLNTVDIAETELDFAGKTLRAKATHQKGGETIVTLDHFTYDQVGRLTEHTQRINNGPEQRIAQNTYDALGQLKQKGVGGTAGGTALQTVDYGYNIRGWLKSINDPNALGTDLFGFGINYNHPQHGAAALYNGNISETSWKTASVNPTANPVSSRYTYSYDALNRITGATGGANSNYDVSNITYDKNGNLQSLIRNGWQNGSDFVNMDVLGYDYQSNSNKLSKVTDTGNRSYGFKEPVTSGDDYRYDPNGNLVMDRNKGIGTATVDGIEYNHLNLPTSISLNTGSIQYIYDAMGTKLKKTVSTGAVTEYAGSYVYSGNQSSTDLQFFAHSEGYVNVENNEYRYVYQYRDHLGNVRLSYVDSNNDGSIDASTEIIEESNYYPFGMKHRGYNSNVSPNGNSVAQKWKFQGVELEESLGLDLYEMEFRNYDAAIGRFMSIDPLAEERNWLTPYNFVQNNPLIRIDPSGLLDDFHIYSDGSIVRQKTDDATDTFIFHDSNGNQHNVATLEKNENGLINSPNINFDSGDGTSVNISSKPENESEINISGTALAAVVGASADSGEEIFITRASNADGSSPGDSTSHIDGNNIDVRFAGQNGGRNPIDFETSVSSFNQIDQDASARMNASLKKFGYKSINASNLSVPMSSGDSGNPTVVTGTVMGTRHLGNHFDHQHLQRFRPNVTIRNKAVPVPTITKGVKL